MYQIYYIWIHPLPILLHFPPPIPGIVSTNIIFPFTCMYTQYLHHIQPPSPFHRLLPTLTITKPSHPKTEPVPPFCSPILYTRKRKKKWHFCLFKIATQEVSLWLFHVYVCVCVCVCVLMSNLGSSQFFFFIP
jgi:hypothetical protein